MARPSTLTAKLTHKDGTTQTVAEAIVERLRAGAYREEAARSVGVRRQSLYNWLYQGALARRLRGDRLTRLITANQARCEEFLDAVERAEAQAMLTDWTRLAQLGAGGVAQVVITEKVNADGHLIERTTRTTHTLPDKDVLMWRLERRWPQKFAKRLELTGAEDRDVEADVADTRTRARMLSAEIKAYQQGIVDGSVMPAPPPAREDA
jgi:hypothetical protein